MGVEGPWTLAPPRRPSPTTGEGELISLPVSKEDRSRDEGEGGGASHDLLALTSAAAVSAQDDPQAPSIAALSPRSRASRTSANPSARRMTPTRSTSSATTGGFVEGMTLAGILGAAAEKK